MSRPTPHTPSAPPARRRGSARGARDLLVDDGAVQLLSVDGRLLLRQGDVAIDVTGVVAVESYQAARLVLNLRRAPEQPVTLAPASGPPDSEP
jgi:hypothetical protein